MLSNKDLNEFIKNYPNVNVTIKASDLLEFGQSIAITTAQTVLSKYDEKIYTRQEVIQKFNICSATLWRWDKMGLINGKKIGNRRYYSESEIKQLVRNR
ncbi:MerR family transcriptional regulator [Bacteroidota bacterium]